MTLLETVTVLAVLGLLCVVGFGPLLRASGAKRTRAAGSEIVSALRLAQSLAVRQTARTALKFRVASSADHTVTYAVYRDGDGDGVLNRDIESGVDPEIAPPRPLAHLGRDVRFGFPPGQAPRDPGDPRRRLTGLDDPIRFNLSDLASFDPLGGATPGSVYLTDGRESLVVVRVLGITGRVRVLSYDAKREVWR